MMILEIILRMMIMMVIVMDGRHMSVQSIFALESPTAECAGELLVSVKGLVSPQVITVAKPLTTSVTNKFGTDTVLSLLMLFEHLSSSERLATNITRNLLCEPVVHIELVCLQSSVRAEVFTTHFTHVV